MAAPSKSRSAIKFAVWALASAGCITHVATSHASGRLARWFYHTAATDGYAVNANAIANGTREQPAVLTVASGDRIEGMTTVAVRKGDRLPEFANGVISQEVLAKGTRAALEGNALKVFVPWEIQQAKGFKFKDTFKHKGVHTYPLGAAWNVLLTLAIGLSLGMMAEGLTDLLGIRLTKIRHFEGH